MPFFTWGPNSQCVAVKTMLIGLDKATHTNNHVSTGRLGIMVCAGCKRQCPSRTVGMVFLNLWWNTW